MKKILIHMSLFVVMIVFPLIHSTSVHAESPPTQEGAHPPVGYETGYGERSRHRSTFDLESGSGELIWMRSNFFETIISLEAKQTFRVHAKRKEGRLTLWVDGCLVDSIRYGVRTSRKWRRHNFVIPKGARRVELVNETGVKIKIQKFSMMRVPVSGMGVGSSYGNSDSESALATIADIAIMLRDYLNQQDYGPYVEVRNKSLSCLATIETYGPISQTSRDCLEEFLPLLEALEPSWDQMMGTYALEELMQNLKLSFRILKRSLT